jgi:hypothetical protein
MNSINRFFFIFYLTIAGVIIGSIISEKPEGNDLLFKCTITIISLVISFVLWSKKK